MKITIINGPNLNLLGKREPEIYGSQGFEGYLEALNARYPNMEISYVQSNIEGELIDALHADGFSADGIVLNAGAYTHTSVGIGDAIKAIATPVVEVHISNLCCLHHGSWHDPFAQVTGDGVGERQSPLPLRKPRRFSSCLQHAPPGLIHAVLLY